MPFFDLATAVQLTQESHPAVVNQLYRWSRAGKLVPLRRGMYAFADRYRRTAVSPAALANALYSPSYISGLWALAFVGLIRDVEPFLERPVDAALLERVNLDTVLAT